MSFLFYFKESTNLIYSRQYVEDAQNFHPRHIGTQHPHNELIE